jgi:hypothetical protein
VMLVTVFEVTHVVCCAVWRGCSGVVEEEMGRGERGPVTRIWKSERESCVGRKCNSYRGHAMGGI